MSDSVILSQEQEKIIDHVMEGKNVAVEAAPGSGKTTTTRYIASRLADIPVRCITYSKNLADDGEKKIKINKSKIKNIKYSTLHSICHELYSIACRDDSGIERIVHNNSLLQKESCLEGFGKDRLVIIFDEVQDFTNIFFSVAQKIIHDVKKMYRTVQIVILGDPWQTVYGFKGADRRYISFASKIWSEPSCFVKCTLSESYRLTKPMAEYFNFMVGFKWIRSCKEGEKVIYIRDNPFEIWDKYQDIIEPLIRDNETFILANSLRSNSSPVTCFENKLVDAGITVNANADRAFTNAEKNKQAVFKTWCSSKGRERSVCIVFGNENSPYIDGNDMASMPALTVAKSRGSKILIIIESSTASPLNNLKYRYSKLMNSDFIEYHGCPPKNGWESHEQRVTQIHKKNVTDLIKYCKSNTESSVGDILSKIAIQTVASSGKKYNFNVKNSELDTYENVSDLVGNIIPAIYEEKCLGRQNAQLQILEKLYNDPDESKRLSETQKAAIREIDRDAIRNDHSNLPVIAHLATTYLSIVDGYTHRLAQLRDYSWLCKDMVDESMKVLSEYVDKSYKFEQTLDPDEIEYDRVNDKIKGWFPEMSKIELRGRVDAINSEYIYETKCKQSLDIEDKSQLAIYLFLYNTMYGDDSGYVDGRLLNVFTGEMFELLYKKNETDIEEIVKLYIVDKYAHVSETTDEEFINKCTNIQNSFKN